MKNKFSSESKTWPCRALTCWRAGRRVEKAEGEKEAGSRGVFPGGARGKNPPASAGDSG